jgi:hypothetical protein
MTDRPDQHDDSLDAPPPKALRDDLASLYDARIDVPPRLDKAILADARRARLSVRDPIPWPVQLFRVAAATAAAAAFALVVWLNSPAGSPPGSTTPAVAKQDINGDGTIDILDAFTLARRIESGAAAGPDLDINNDGRVDAADVDAVAARAVALRGGRS